MPEKKERTRRSQDFYVAAAGCRGEQVEYPDQLAKWDAAEDEKPGKRGNCHVCTGNGKLWVGEEQKCITCWGCHGTGKITDE